MIFLTTLLIAMFITLALIPIFKTMAVKLNVMDIPEERKVHPYPMPKTGGLAMAVGTLVPVFFWEYGNELVQAVMVAAGIVVFFGFIDDVKGLGYKAKFGGQLIGALVVIFFGGIKINSLGMLLPENMLLPNWLATIITVFFLVGVTNAINLSDGLDGLAGGISLLSFACIGYLAYQGENYDVAIMATAVIGAIFGFLRYNTYPAVVFMGDSGSQFIGFLAGVLSIEISQGNTPISRVLPLILLGFPVFDTLTVMYERVTEGRSPFLADKKHFHHRLMRMGLFHTEAVFVIYLLQAFLVTIAFVFRFHSEWLLLGFYFAFSGTILAGLHLKDRNHRKLRRFEFIDNGIKRRLKKLKQKGTFAKLSFRTVEIGVPLLLLSLCILPSHIPNYYAYFSIFLFLMIASTWLTRPNWLGAALALTLFVMIPFGVYFSERDIVQWMDHNMVVAYNLSFGILVFCVVLTLKLTRRTKGFKTSPLHFIILFIALIVPNLPDEQIKSYEMGLMATKIIVLFFSCEILMGELRAELKKIALITLLALIVTAVRGFVQI